MPRLRRCVLLSLLVVTGLAITASTAFASHFRYGTITWQVTNPATPNVVTIRFDSAWRWTFPWGTASTCPPGSQSPGLTGACPALGSQFTLPYTIDVLNSSNTVIASFQPLVTVTAVNSIDDWFTLSSQNTLTLPAVAASYTIRFTNCCRISTLRDGNNDQNWIVTSGMTISTGGAINQPPTAATPPIVALALNQPAVYGIPASDPNGDQLTFRVATSAESGLPVVSPAGLSLSSSGVITWTPTAVGLYAFQARVTDTQGAFTVVDLIFSVQSASGLPATVLINGNSAPQSATVTAGTPFSFTVSATDPENQTVTLSSSALPIGANMTPALALSQVNPSSTFNWQSPVVGNYVITFSGLDGGGNSDTNSMSLTVVNPQVATTTTLTSSANPSVFGQPVTFTAHVTPNSGSGVPTGTVQFKLDGSNFGAAVSLLSQSASIVMPALAVGGHSVDAVYSGDLNFLTGTASLSQTVSKANTTATLDPMSPSPVGQSVSLVAHVAAVAPASGTPSGSIEFFDGMTSLGISPLSGGMATFTTNSLTGGSHAITANYAGDSGFNGSSANGNKVMNPVTPSVTASGSPNTSTFGQTVVITATVTGAPSVPVTGSVTFSEGANTFGTSSLVGGVATITLGNSNVGPHTILAKYNGDASYNAAQANASITVNKATPVVVLASDGSPAAFLQPVTFTATVTAPAGSPNGSITFSIDGVQIFGTPVAVSGTTGTATFINGAIGVGSHVVTATFNGNGLLNPASGSVNQAISAPAAPPFTQTLPMPSGACICTPLVENVSVAGSEYWFAKAGSTWMTVDAYAVSVNNTDPETVQMDVFDASNTLLGTVTASYPAGTAQGTVVPTALGFPTTAGDVYRIVISTPNNTPPTQAHYRLKFEGASSAAMSAINAVEELSSDLHRWFFNVAAGEQLGVRLFPSSFVPNGFAKNVTLQVFDTANPSVPVPVLDASNNPVTTLTLSSPAGIAFTVQLATPAPATSVYEVLLTQADGHYRIARLATTPVGTNADTGTYLSWQSSGYGHVNITVSSSAPFGGTVHVSGSSIDLVAIDKGNGNGEDLPLGLTTVNEAATGHYHLTFTAPAGFIVTPSEVDIDVLCDATTDINLTVIPTTTATMMTAPAITYGANGVVTVSVTSPAGSVAGSVDLTVDGGVVLTQPLTAGSAVFAVPGLTAGDHALAASFAAQGIFLASDTTGTMHVDKAMPTIVVTPYSVTYDGASHSATGSAIGAAGEALAGLSLAGTAHANAGSYADAWTFADVTGNYSNASGSITDSIAKAAITVVVNNKSRPSQASNPPLDGTVTGVAPGDGIFATYAATSTSVPGSYPITATVQDPNGKLGNYTVSITNGVLTVLDAPPVAIGDSYQSQWNAPLVVAAPGVLGNDTDPDHDVLTATVVTGPVHGTVTLNANGGFTYHPNANFTGADTFTYRASDGVLISSVATVTLNVTGSCRADRDDRRPRHHDGDDDDDFDADDCRPGTPIAADDKFSMNHDSTLTVVSSKSVLRNDGPLARTALLVQAPAHGTLTLNADGTFTYVPAPGFSGVDAFRYAAQGATGIVGPVATVTISVRPNLAPDADNDYYGVKRNTTLTVAAADGVLANDDDPNGDTISAAVVSGPAHGTLTLGADGRFVYKPAANFVGIDSFTYRTVDAYGAADTATVVINVFKDYDDHGHDVHGSKHHDNDDCDHEHHRNGHFDGDGCEHDRQNH